MRTSSRQLTLQRRLNTTKLVDLLANVAGALDGSTETFFSGNLSSSAFVAGITLIRRALGREHALTNVFDDFPDTLFGLGVRSMTATHTHTGHQPLSCGFTDTLIPRTTRCEVGGNLFLHRLRQFFQEAFLGHFAHYCTRERTPRASSTLPLAA